MEFGLPEINESLEDSLVEVVSTFKAATFVYSFVEWKLSHKINNDLFGDCLVELVLIKIKDNLLLDCKLEVLSTSKAPTFVYLFVKWKLLHKINSNLFGDCLEEVGPYKNQRQSYRIVKWKCWPRLRQPQSI